MLHPLSSVILNSLCGGLKVKSNKLFCGTILFSLSFSYKSLPLSRPSYILLSLFLPRNSLVYTSFSISSELKLLLRPLVTLCSFSYRFFAFIWITLLYTSVFSIREMVVIMRESSSCSLVICMSLTRSSTLVIWLKHWNVPSGFFLRNSSR